jgi:hypothetical protein
MPTAADGGSTGPSFVCWRLNFLSLSRDQTEKGSDEDFTFREQLGEVDG